MLSQASDDKTQTVVPLGTQTLVVIFRYLGINVSIFVLSGSVGY